MIVSFISIWALSAAQSYLAADVWLTRKENTDMPWLPYCAAAFPPLGAVLAISTILETAK